MLNLISSLPTLSPFYLFILILLIFITTYNPTPSRRQKINCPHPEESPRQQKRRWSWDTATLIQDAYQKFYGRIFQVFTSDGPLVLIPHRMIDEIKAFPDEVLSASAGVAEALQSKYTTLQVEENPYGVTFVRTMLTRNIGRFLPGMKAELDHVLPMHFETYTDWTPLQIHPKIITLIASLAASTFVGSPLCRSEVWLSTLTSYAKNVFISATILKLFPLPLRPLFQIFIPHLWRLRSCNRIAARIVEEVLNSASEDEDGEGNALSAVKIINSMLPEELKHDYMFQGKGQLGLAAASIDTTARLLTNCIYDLAAHPECVSFLREEIMGCVGGGVYTTENLARMRMLDSFMKEVLRMEASGIITMRRKVMKDITLSDGTYLPLNTYISIPAAAIAFDPTLLTDPATFDPLRFYNLRLRSLEDKNKHQFASLDNSTGYFGAGRHACPGRFFANTVTKLVLAELVSRYDFRLKEGEERPRDFVYQSLRVSQPREVLVRSRKVD